MPAVAVCEQAEGGADGDGELPGPHRARVGELQRAQRAGLRRVDLAARRGRRRCRRRPTCAVAVRSSANWTWTLDASPTTWAFVTSVPFASTTKPVPVPEPVRTETTRGLRRGVDGGHVALLAWRRRRWRRARRRRAARSRRGRAGVDEAEAERAAADERGGDEAAGQRGAEAAAGRGGGGGAGAGGGVAAVGSGPGSGTRARRPPSGRRRAREGDRSWMAACGRRASASDKGRGPP